MKKLVALMVALMLVLSSGAMAYTISDPGVIPCVDEVVTYNIVGADVSYVCDLNENTLTQWIADQTNVQIVWEEIPDNAIEEKTNLLIASDELPDAFIYCSFNSSKLADYGAQGVFLPLNDLIDEHGFYVKQVYEYLPAAKGGYTSLDGNIYTLPDINECYHCTYAYRAWINQVWLDKLGLAYPNTLDELCEVLRAFKTQDPNGNGIADEIPMSACADGWNTLLYPFLMGSFLYCETNYLSVDADGNVVFTATQDAYKEGLKYIRSMIEEGLIEVESLTQTAEQLKTKGCGDDALLGSFVAATWWTATDSDSGEGCRARDYVGLSPLEGPNGYRNSPKTSEGYNMGSSVITTACEDPVPLFKMLDYMLSPEGTLRSQQGKEGEDYFVPEEGKLGINGKPALYGKLHDGSGSEGTDEQINAMENVFPSNRTSDFRLGELADYDDPETQWKQEPRLFLETNKYFEPYCHAEEDYPAVNFTPEESEEKNFMQSNIETAVKQWTVSFLAGEKDVDADWDAYLEELASYKLDDYVELMQTGYTRQYGAN